MKSYAGVIRAAQERSQAEWEAMPAERKERLRGVALVDMPLFELAEALGLLPSASNLRRWPELLKMVEDLANR